MPNILNIFNILINNIKEYKEFIKKKEKSTFYLNNVEILKDPNISILFKNPIFHFFCKMKNLNIDIFSFLKFYKLIYYFQFELILINRELIKILPLTQNYGSTSSGRAIQLMKNIKKLSFKNGIIYDNKTQIILKKLARSINFLFEFWSHLNFFYITQFNK